METDDDDFHVVGKDRKAHTNPTSKQHHSSATPTRTGQSSFYTTKIRAILTQKDKNQDLLIGATTKSLLKNMFALDNNMKIHSTIDQALSINDITQFPTDKTEFLKFFEYKELHKRNGHMSITIYFNIKSTTKEVLGKMKTNNEFLQFLRRTNVFTFEHSFEGHELQRIGFFSELLHHSIHTKEFQKRIETTLQHAIQNTQFTTVPLFAINASKTYHRERTNNGQNIMFRTEAFEMETTPNDASTLVEIMMMAKLPIQQYGTFTPYSILREDPQLLIQKIEDNNNYKSVMTTMYLNGCHHTVLDSIIEDN